MGTKTSKATPKPDVRVFCPRCDKSFAALRKRDAIAYMDEHVKKAHPDYYESLNT